MSGQADVLFLTAAGPGVGLGHLKRCLALGAALRELGAGVGFAVAGDAGRLSGMRLAPLDTLDWTEEPGLALAAVARWRPAAVVVDSYAATPELVADLRSAGAYVAAIDDLGDGPVPADLVVNGAYGAERLRYRGLPETVFLLGPAYALLEPAYAAAPQRSPRRPVGRVLVTLGGEGGGAPLGEAVAAVARAVPHATLDVVVGPFGAEPVTDGGRFLMHRALPSLRPLLLVTDLAVTAAGMTLYECLASGTPAVALCLADNQRRNFKELGQAGLVLAGQPDLEAAVARLAGDEALRESMSAQGRDVVDGNGASRVAAEIARTALALQPRSR